MDSLVEGTVKQVKQVAADSIKAVVTGLVDSTVTDTQTGLDDLPLSECQ